MSWAHLTRKEEIRQQKITREGQRGAEERTAWEERERAGERQRRGKRVAEQQKRKDNISKLKSRDEKMWDKMWRFRSSQRNLLMTSSLRARSERSNVLQTGLSASFPYECTQLTQQFIKQTAQYPHTVNTGGRSHQLTSKHSETVKSKPATKWDILKRRVTSSREATTSN